MKDLRLNSVQFLEDKHEYWYTDGKTHKRLYGVTGSIGKMLGKNFPDTLTVQASVIYGHDVHSESENWIKNQAEPSTESGKWIVQYLKDFQNLCKVEHFDAELIVSDFEATASCIDIVAHLPKGKAVLFDIKTTSHFDRPYCSLQLSVYKKLFEGNYGEKVEALYVLGTKSKRAFRILDQDEAKVTKVLEINKAI